MSQSPVQTAVNTFVKGLITEASPLTFPENASVDELNCDLSRTGTRSRRKAIGYEDLFEYSSFTATTDDTVQSVTWRSVSSSGALDFEVIQVNSTLYFYSKSEAAISPNRKSFSVDLTPFKVPGSKPINDSKFSGATINGLFVVVHPSCEPFFIEYDDELDSIATTTIVPKIRDFEILTEDIESLFTNPETIDEKRRYDSYNAGWYLPFKGRGPILDQHFNGGTNRRYPQLTHPWYVGKTIVGTSPSYSNDLFFNTFFKGNSLTGFGHYLLEVFRKDRSAVSGIDGLETEILTTRFTSVAAFAGRVWYSGLSSPKESGKLFFTKVIERNQDFSICYQENDPTAEDISDLLDSDGGVINIPEARNIKSLFTFGSSLLVFAENGVWEVGGVDQVFKATEFFVNRITSIGVTSQNSFVDAEGTPFWWGSTGIFSMSKDEINRNGQASNLSLGTIQTFWEQIPVISRDTAQGIYDKVNRRVYWLYSSNSLFPDRYDKVLILDITLQAFFPWEFSVKETDSPVVVGAFYVEGIGTVGAISEVVVNDVLVEANAVQVLVTENSPVSISNPKIKFIVIDPLVNKITFAEIRPSSLQDWGSETYSSYAETGYDYSGDLSSFKNPVYITTVMDKIPSASLLMKTFWDYKSNLSSESQLYRNTYRRDETVITRVRIRGRGRVMTMRFESVGDSDFALHGYEVVNVKNNGL